MYRFLSLFVVLVISLSACNSTDSGPQASKDDLPQEGELSFEDASQIILENVLDEESLADRPFIVFGWPELLVPGDEIYPYEFANLESYPARNVISQESWFFWIDEAAGANFAHPTQFVFVVQATGEVIVSNELWWPVLNGMGLWVDESDYWDESNWVQSNIDEPLTEQGSQSNIKTTALLIVDRQQENSNLGSAIVLNVWEEGEVNQEDFESSSNDLHDSFSDADFDTTFLGPPTDDNPDRDGEASLENINTLLREKADEMKPSETLFIYIGGHGTVQEDGKAWTGNLDENFLRRRLEMFDPGVHIIVIIDSCYSGAHLDGLKDVADITITATNATTASYGDLDWWFTVSGDYDRDDNPDDRGSEFISGFIEDWNLIMSDPDEKARVQARADREGTNFWEALSAESYLSAVEKDLTYRLGWTFPQLSRGSEATRPNQAIHLEAAEDCTDTAGSPVSACENSGIDVARVVVEPMQFEEFGAGLSISIETHSPGTEVPQQVILGFDWDQDSRTGYVEAAWPFMGTDFEIFADVGTGTIEFAGMLDAEGFTLDSPYEPMVSRDTNGTIRVHFYSTEGQQESCAEMPETPLCNMYVAGLLCGERTCDWFPDQEGGFISLPPGFSILRSFRGSDTILDDELEPDAEVLHNDEEGDVVDRHSGNDAGDPGADILDVRVVFVDNELRIKVNTKEDSNHLDYSRAVTVTIKDAEENERKLVCEYHEGIFFAGEVNPETALPIPSDFQFACFEPGLAMEARVNFAEFSEDRAPYTLTVNTFRAEKSTGPVVFDEAVLENWIFENIAP